MNWSPEDALALAGAGGEVWEESLQPKSARANPWKSVLRRDGQKVTVAMKEQPIHLNKMSEGLCRTPRAMRSTPMCL